MSLEYKTPQRSGSQTCSRTFVHQRGEEHKRSVIGTHVKGQHGNEPQKIEKNFIILRKFVNKFDFFIFEMFYIQNEDLLPNQQS